MNHEMGEDWWESQTSLVLSDISRPEDIKFAYVVFRDNNKIFASGDKIEGREITTVEPKSHFAKVQEKISFKENSQGLFKDLCRGVRFYDKDICEWYKSIYDEKITVDNKEGGKNEYTVLYDKLSDLSNKDRVGAFETAYNALLKNKKFQVCTGLTENIGKWFGQYWVQDFAASQLTILGAICPLVGMFNLVDKRIYNKDEKTECRSIQYDKERGIYGYGSAEIMFTIPSVKRNTDNVVRGSVIGFTQFDVDAARENERKEEKNRKPVMKVRRIEIMGSANFVTIVKLVIHTACCLSRGDNKIIISDFFKAVQALKNTEKKNSTWHDLATKRRKRSTEEGYLLAHRFFNNQRSKIKQVIMATYQSKKEQTQRHIKVPKLVHDVFLMVDKEDFINNIKQFIYEKLPCLSDENSKQQKIVLLYKKIMTIMNPAWKFWWKYENKSFFYSLANIKLTTKNYRSFNFPQKRGASSGRKVKENALLKEFYENNNFFMRTHKANLLKWDFSEDDNIIIPPYGNASQWCEKLGKQDKKALLNNALFQRITGINERKGEILSGVYTGGLRNISEKIFQDYLTPFKKIICKRQQEYKQIFIFEKETQQFLWMIVAQFSYNSLPGSFIFYWTYTEVEKICFPGFRLEKIELVGHEKIVNLFSQAEKPLSETKKHTVNFVSMEHVLKKYNTIHPLVFLNQALLNIENSATVIAKHSESKQTVVHFSSGEKGVTPKEVRALGLLTTLYNKKIMKRLKIN